MSEDLHRLSSRGQFVVTRERNENFIADTADIDDRLSGQRGSESAVEKGDHEAIPNQRRWKSQVPNPKSQTNSKFQISKEENREPRVRALVIGNWEFLGIWSLG